MAFLITVERYKTDSDATVSRIYVEGQLFCYGLEDAKRTTKIKGKTCIPDGIYRLKTRWSPRFSRIYKHEMIWVTEVPNFEYILIHWGNTISDTEGCLLVGDSLTINQTGQEFLLNSRKTYLRLYNEVIEKIKNGLHYIEYKTIN